MIRPQKDFVVWFKGVIDAPRAQLTEIISQDYLHRLCKNEAKWCSAIAANKMSPEFTNTKTSRQVPLKVETARAPFAGFDGASPPRNTAVSLRKRDTSPLHTE
jgi:hypothetical protein